MRKYWVSALSAVIAVGGTQVQAEEVKELEPVKVTAMLKEQELKEVPLSVAVVTAEEIERSTASTTAELLEDIPGVQVFDGGMSGMIRVGIRGESERTSVLIDGIRVSEQKSMSGAPILISPEQIERIELIKGPGSVLYGSEAIGGVVNIITKKEYSLGPHAWVNGSYDTAKNGGTYSTGASYGEGNVIARTSVSLSDFENRDSADGEVKNTNHKSTTVDASVDYRTEDLDAGVAFSHYDAEYSVYTGNDSMYMDLPEWKRDKINAYVEKRDITDALVKLRVDAYYQNTKKDFINDIDWGGVMGGSPFAGTWSEFKETQNDQDTLGLKLQSDWLRGHHYTVAGIDLMYDHLKSDDRATTTATGMFLSPMFGLTPGATEANPDASRFSSAVFASDEWTFADDWALTFGARGTYSHTDNEADPATSTESGDEDDFNGTLSVALVNTSFEDTTLRAVVSQGYRQPTLGELYTTSGMAGEYITGNPDLDEETSVSGELGARYYTPSWLLDAAVFYTQAEDYIDYADDATAASGSSWQNMDEATTFGAELQVRYDFQPAADRELALYANSTFMRRKYDSAGDESYDTGYPSITARLGVRTEQPLNSRLSGWADGYVRCATAADTSSTTEDPGWSTLNFKTGLKFSASEDAFYESASLEIGLLNLLDKQYTEARNSIVAAGRGLYVSAGMRF